MDTDKNNNVIDCGGGPWYESDGPTPHVKEIMFNKYEDQCSDSLTEELLREILVKIIPDTRNDFNSWRGLSTFVQWICISGDREGYCKEILAKANA